MTTQPAVDTSGVPPRPDAGSLSGETTVDCRIPIVIGITGHRDPRPDCVETLRATVLSLLEEKRTAFPNSPLWLLSGLAEGADSLVAEEFLALPDARLVAVLPFPKEEFERDFSTETTLATFHRLLEKSSCQVVLAPAFDSLHGDRDAAYEKVGTYLVRHSHILLALWDGQIAGKQGGTSHVVQMQFQGLPDDLAPYRRPFDPVDVGPVEVLATPRSSGQPLPTSAVGALRVLEPAADADTRSRLNVWNSRLTCIDNYNRRITGTARVSADEISKSAQYLIPADKLESATGLDALAQLRMVFATADATATHLQRTTQGWYKWLLLLFVTAMLAVQLYGGPIMWVGLMGTYLLLFLMIARLDRKKDQDEEDYFEIRGLAEGLRVQFFWKLTGVKASAADVYIRGQQDVLGWIPVAIRTTEIGSESRPVPPGAVDMARQHWVQDQCRYFRGASGKIGAAEREKKKADMAGRWTSVIRWFGIVAALLTVILSLLAESVGDEPLQWLLVISGMALLGVSAINNFASSMAWSEQAMRYGKMGTYFTRALRALDKMRELEPAERSQKGLGLLYDLGLEALTESGDWVLLHRERPLDFKLEG